MNEETFLAVEETSDSTGEPTTSPTEVQDLPTDDWIVTETTSDIVDLPDATIWEGFYGSEYQEVLETTSEPVTVEIIESVGSDICHSVLFSGFLVCGTLVGCALLRKIYGT